MSSPLLSFPAPFDFFKLDNYGFTLVEDEDEDKHLPSLLKMYQPLNDKKIQAQRTRWHKELAKKHTLTRDMSELKRLCRKGIPPEMRGLVWFHLSGAAQKKQKDPNLYKNLLNTHKNQVTEATKQIDNDIDRTYPEHPFISQADTRQLLRNILVAYAFYNPHIGYCQSMNFLAAILLLHMGEENAFYTLTCMLSDDSYLPQDLFDPTLNGLYCETHVLDKLVQERYPKIHAHLKKLDVNMVLFATKWFMLVFLNVFPMETSLRIWDTFFYEGYKVLFRIGLTFLHMQENKIMATESIGDVLQLIGRTAKEVFDCRMLLKNSFQIRRFDRKKIQTLRHDFAKQKSK
jgi:hypothetical protein